MTEIQTDPVPPAAPSLARAATIEAIGVHRSYEGVGAEPVSVLRGVDLRVESGEAVAIIGASGAGKSTFLHLLGALDRPTDGEVLVGGQAISRLDDTRLAAVRNAHLGFVFQFHHLLREFTAVENVMMPRLIGGAEPGEARERAEALLGSVGLDHRFEHKPSELSGGEQQRVAVARALANEPLALLADEPSGNLDHHTSEALHDVLFGVREERNLSMVLVTHNLELAGRADRILLLEDGVLVPAEL